MHLTKIYTRTGDGGETRLADMSVTRKTDPRVQAYGDVDEANSAIGIALSAGLPDDVEQVLRHVQNELFDLGADLATPVADQPDQQPEALRIIQSSVDRLESWCDLFSASQPALRSFILPGGTLGASYLHLARTITRRAERSAWAASERAADGAVNPLAITYLNRLSDLLFILTRTVNGAEGDIAWVPGGDRNTGRRTTADPTPTHD